MQLTPFVYRHGEECQTCGDADQPIAVYLTATDAHGCCSYEWPVCGSCCSSDVTLQAGFREVVDQFHAIGVTSAEAKVPGGRRERGHSQDAAADTDSQEAAS